MRIEIEIPKEFESDYGADKFNEFFGRVKADIGNGVLCGRYEKETIKMLESAFKQSKAAYDVEKVVQCIYEYFMQKIDACEEDIIPHEILEYNKAICEIVRKGGVE